MHEEDLRYVEPSQLAIAVAKFSFSINRKGILSGIGTKYWEKLKYSQKCLKLSKFGKKIFLESDRTLRNNWFLFGLTQVYRIS